MGRQNRTPAQIGDADGVLELLWLLLTTLQAVTRPHQDLVLENLLWDGKTSVVLRRHVRRRGAAHSAPGATGSGRSSGVASVSASAVRASDAVAPGCKLRQHGPKMLLVQDNDVVETLSPQGANHSLHDSVRRWRVDRGGDGIDADASGALAEVAPVDRVTITKQVSRLLTPGCGLDHLPPHPGSRRVGRHIQVHQLASTVGNEDQDVQRLERQRWHRQQVGGPEMVGVVTQECAPTLTGWAPRRSPAVPPNQAVGDLDAELEQLPADPLGASQAVVARHGRDEVPHLRAELRTPASGAGLPAPEQAPALPMPAHDRLGCDEGQMLAPAAQNRRARIHSSLSQSRS